ncbi:MAG: AraC family transcriptional regulator [Spirochaetaceae bacterium]
MLIEQHIYKQSNYSNRGYEFLDNSIRCGFISKNKIVKEVQFSTSQYALVYIVEGSGTYSDSNGVFSFKKGDIFQRVPNIVHDVTYSKGAKRFYVAIPNEIFNIIKLTGDNFHKEAVHSIGYDKIILDKIDKLFTFCNSDCDLFKILIQIQNFISDCINLSKQNDTELEQIIKMLCDSKCHLSLEEMTFKLGMNYHSFRRKFKSCMNVSPGEYRIQKKIEAAISLLLYRDKTISDISKELGYNDLYTFSSQFKKHTGLSPMNFRNRVH